MEEKPNREKSSLAGRIHLLARFGGCILAAIPSTILPVPLPLSVLFSRRYRRETALKRLHAMVPWARFCRKRILKMSLDVQGRENIPDIRRGYMFVSNHQSYVDILVLMDALNTVSFLSKDLVKYIPLIGQHAWAAGTIYFNRRDRESRQKALDDTLRMCRESTAVVVFPEGTRSEDGNLREKIYPGAIEAAYQQSLKIIPVGLDGTSFVLPKAMDRVVLHRPVAVTIGEPMDPAGCTDIPSWVESVWQRVRQLHQESRRRLSGAGPSPAREPGPT